MKNHRDIYIIGANHEAINAGILLASLHKAVHFLALPDTLDDTLAHYQFDRQIHALWSLYRQDKITTYPKHHRDELIAFCQNAQGKLLWVFIDEHSTCDELALIAKIVDNPHTQVIISGIGAMGRIQQFADKFISKWVYYLPFVFMKDGANFSSFYQADLVLIGEKTPNSVEQCEILSFLKSQATTHQIAPIKTIEFARATIMAQLATRLSFMNEMARLADKENINIKDIERIIGSDSRVGHSYLGAGWGFGGKSLPSELDLLKHQFDDQAVKSHVLDAVMQINEDQKELIFRKFWRYFNGFIEHKTVLIWGAGYRSGAGISTGSAIHPLLALLWSYHIKTVVYANQTTFELKARYGDEPLFHLTDDPYQALADVDGLFIINWSELVKPDVHELNKAGVPIFDAKNILSDDDVACLTGDYIGIGRKN